MTPAEAAHIKLIRSMRCVVCKRFTSTGLPTEAHHLGTGSSQRNHFLLAPLCGKKGIEGKNGHHRGILGYHGPNGTKWFISFYKVPHGSEYGLLAWVNEDLAEMRGQDAAIF